MKFLQRYGIVLAFERNKHEDNFEFYDSRSFHIF